MTNEFDCALLFALEEEFTIIESYKEIYTKNACSYFNYVDKEGIRRSCLVDYVSKPSIHNAYKFTLSLLEKVKVKTIFIIGISGQLSDDVNIGDVIISNQINWYDYDQKYNSDEFNFSGDTKRTDWLGDIFSKLNKKESDKIITWKEIAYKTLNQYFLRESIEKLTELKFIRKDGNIIYKYGKIASGTGVVDDPKLKESILKKDRKLLCVDMESYGFADAISEDINICLIRAVSDTADGRKKQLDNFAGNIDGLRKWALDNAFRFFESIILKVIPFDNNSQICNYQPRPIEKIDLFIDNNREKAFDCYSKLFQEDLLSIGKDDSNFYQTYTEKILDKSNSPIIVKGLPGTGKTTLLYSWYKYLIYKGINCNYINVHNFKKSYKKTIHSDFADEIRIILNDAEAQILIIDGLDEYERFFINQNITINDYWSEIVARYNHIILGVTQQDFKNVKDERRLFFVNSPKITIGLTSFSFTKDSTDKIIRGILEINNASFDRVGLIKFFFDNSNIKELDWHTANHLIKKLGTFNYENIKSLGEFFHIFSQYFFAKNKVSFANGIEFTSSLAFRKYIKETKLKEAEYRSANWIFIQQSNTIKQFLIAEHLIQNYVDLNKDYDSSIKDLNYVYSYKINSFFKDNLNRTEQIQKCVFESIKNKYSELSFQQKPNACYILGRFEMPVLRSESTKLLSKFLKEEIEIYEKGEFRNDQTLFRQHLLLIRTIYISLVYQGEMGASDDYLNYVLTNSEWDDLNRGFHLEYYGDKPYDPTKLGLHKDDTAYTFIKTYKRLSIRIKKYLSGLFEKEYLMFDIELQTISSLAVNRFIKGQLSIDIKTDFEKLLSDILHKHTDLYKNDRLNSYISLVYYILSNNKNSISSILEDIYKIKLVKRSGWNYSGPRRGIRVERVVSNPESVADHTYGTILLALLYLPENIENEKKYSKRSIIDMLLIHDLAESFTGDLLTFKKGEDEIEKENRQMKLILSLSILDGFGDFSKYYELWNDFITKKTINGKIANDIDKIENYVQLQEYYNVTGNKISDFEEWKQSIWTNVITRTGKNLLKKLTINN